MLDQQKRCQEKEQYIRKTLHRHQITYLLKMSGKINIYALYSALNTKNYASIVAQRKRIGLITQGSLDRNQSMLTTGISFLFFSVVHLISDSSAYSYLLVLRDHKLNLRIFLLLQ